MPTSRFSKLRSVFPFIEFVVGTGVFVLLTWALLRAGTLSLEDMPAKDEERLRTVTAQLAFLEHALKQENATEEMQAVFPEGACFLLTLYGLAWSNVAEQTVDPLLSEKAVAELAWTLAEQQKKYVIEPFHQTQVRLGVFGLGQRNLLLGRALEVTPERQRRVEWVGEFHENSRELAAAFRASPTHHLDSYTGMCWPADNVTALVSLLIHDRMYGTDYSEAYRAWKAWTLAHPTIEGTALPAGKLDSQTGHLDEPARGCANSWICGVLAAEDPEFAMKLYHDYVKYFAINRLGFAMFREYPIGNGRKADVDSGPIVWGAGMTATGIGLAAARACGDAPMARDIYNLAGVWGWPRWTRKEDRKLHHVDIGQEEMQKQYLWGRFPMGDAFLAWGMSLEGGKGLGFPSPTKWETLRARWAFYATLAGLFGLLGLREGFVIRKFIRRRKAGHGMTPTPQPLSAASEDDIRTMSGK